MGIALAEKLPVSVAAPKTDDQPKLYISDRSVTPRSISSVMIVCGNCMGEDRLPRKTFLSADGSGCASCGSQSYVLASKLSTRR